MAWLAQYGVADPVVIPRSDLTRDEVRDALSSRLVSGYVVASGPGDCVVTVVVPGRRSSAATPLTVMVQRHDDASTYVDVGPGARGRDARKIRRLLRSAPELRTSPVTPVVTDNGTIPDGLVSLLSVYSGQFGSYTTLLWQVPALGLTAQSFLLTIALMNGTSSGARIVACGLSLLIATASAALMHNQRGRAINHAELLRRLSEKMKLTELLNGAVEIDDGAPKKTNAQNVWAVDHLIYHGWIWCMYLFGVADILIILAVWFRPSLLH